MTGCKSKNKYCSTNRNIIINPFTLLYGNHKTYILCNVFGRDIYKCKFVDTKINKNTCHSNEYIKNKIIIMPAKYGFERIITKYQSNNQFNKDFANEPHSFVYHNGMEYGSQYIIHLNIRGRCTVFEMKCSQNLYRGYYYENPKILFAIDIPFYPLGIIYANVNSLHNMKKSYILMILLINGSYHEYVIDINSYHNTCVFNYQKKNKHLIINY